MKLLLIIAAMAIVAGSVTETANTKRTCVGVHRGINFYRDATHTWQKKLGIPLTKSSKAQIKGCAYAKWVAELWRKRTNRVKTRYAEHLAWMKLMESPTQAIKHVFGEYYTEALAVARCESGLSVWASNGQYLGLFQMGSSERSLYGHGYTPLAQAQAAYRYFIDSGRDWSPWQCKPY